MKKVLGNIGALIFVLGWGVGGTIGWWVTGKEDWLYGWVITLIFLLAG